MNGYTEANFGTGSHPAGFDTDNDGIPDEWERANGLNPNDANDAKQYTIDSKKWYTNLEVYANSLVQDIMLKENADAEEDVAEYYPAYVDPTTGKTVAAINEDANDDEQEEQNDVAYTISQTTNTGNNTTASWEFNDNITVTNTKSKAYQAGKNDGVKYSAGVQYTINLPQNVYINKMMITGYDNYAEADAYLGELNGEEFDSSTYMFPRKDASGNFTTKSYDIGLSTPAQSSITFTPQGKQVVWSITLAGTKGTTAVANIEDLQPIGIEYYNLQGMRINKNYRGIIICKKRLPNGRYISVKEAWQ